MPDARHPMTPDEFDRNSRRLERIHRQLSLTSGRRSLARNEEVGGSTGSKHLLGMARDYAAPDTPRDYAAPDTPTRDAALGTAKRLGFWIKPYEWGLHIQGLPPGDPPEWWVEKYGRG